MPLRRSIAAQYRKEFGPSSEVPSTPSRPGNATHPDARLQPSPSTTEHASAKHNETTPDDLVRQAIRLRREYGLTQKAFAKEIGIPRATLKDWEQGRRRPRGPSRALLEQCLASQR